ncbi:apoptosis regulatory protein Siva-like isoform X2 [Oncorhynchus masou masou]|uniref:apoptosis regulatory protein Siva-like isoform X2 n=1 Tax=Oncorhynchus masou masou TaxID=90313 RepID=UPI0031838C71
MTEPKNVLPYISVNGHPMTVKHPQDFPVLLSNTMSNRSYSEKTKTLLFNGTKAVMGKIWNIDTEKCSTIQSSGPGVTPDVSRTLLRGQTLIGQDGRLTRVQGAVLVSKGSCVCQKAQRTRRQCSQCDRPACPSCIQQCSNCSRPCCSVCTVIDYSGQYEQVLCCGCSS